MPGVRGSGAAGAKGGLRLGSAGVDGGVGTSWGAAAGKANRTLLARNLSSNKFLINQRFRINVHANVLQEEEIIELDDWWVLLPDGDICAQIVQATMY